MILPHGNEIFLCKGHLFEITNNLYWNVSRGTKAMTRGMEAVASVGPSGVYTYSRPIPLYTHASYFILVRTRLFFFLDKGHLYEGKNKYFWNISKSVKAMTNAMTINHC